MVNFGFDEPYTDVANFAGFTVQFYTTCHHEVLHLLPCLWERDNNVHKVMTGSCLLQCHVHMQACLYSSTHKQR
jgi:hypothetical protein